MKFNKNLEMKGNFKRQKNRFIYRNKLIICRRKGSVVKVKDDKILIYADVTGVDKVYFSIIDKDVMISDRFKDFIDNGINEKFMDFQKKMGYVPYPFTILNNVKKSPPGLITVITIDKRGKPRYTYEKGGDLHIFSINKRFDKKTFKKEFNKRLIYNTRCIKGMISSFSGGFDSLLLTEIYKNKCKHILHFRENENINADYFKNLWPNLSWTTSDHLQKFTEEDRKKYFQAIDEPSCDSAGFAEYLMIKKLILNKRIRSLPIMNGQGADGLFANGRLYFQQFISNKLHSPLNKLKLTYKTKDVASFISRVSNYFIGTKERFFKYYFPNYNLTDEAYLEFERIYEQYAKTIDNDPVNFLAALVFILYYSVHGIEKINASSRAFHIRYYLPFLSTNIIECAFSVPSKYKVGLKRGKRILIKAHPEVKKTKFVSQGFAPSKLKEIFVGKKLKSGDYEQYYIRNWIKYNSN